MQNSKNIEMNDMFDLLYNNSFSNNAPNINLFEKSLYLTKAQEELIKNKLLAAGNKYQSGAEGIDKRMVEMNELINVESLPLSVPTTLTVNSRSLTADYNNTNLQSNILMVLNEVVRILHNDKITEKQVVPLSFSEYERLMAKPYKAPLKNQVWKLETSTYSGVSTTYKEFIFTYDDHALFYQGATADVIIRYVKRPTPIILFNTLQSGSTTVVNTSLDDQNYSDPSYTIEGIHYETPCMLNRIWFDEIVQRAVEIAKGTYSVDEAGNVQLQNQLNLGQRSE